MVRGVIFVDTAWKNAHIIDMANFYERFISGLRFADDTADMGLLTVITLCLLGALFLYQILLTVIVIKMKKRGGDVNTILHINGLRRWAVLLSAWFWVAFILINVFPKGATFGQISVDTLILPASFLFVVYLLEYILAFITHRNFPVHHIQKQIEYKPQEKITHEPQELLPAPQVRLATSKEKNAVPPPPPLNPVVPEYNPEPTPEIVHINDVSDLVEQPVKRAPVKRAGRPATKTTETKTARVTVATRATGATRASNETVREMRTETETITRAPARRGRPAGVQRASKETATTHTVRRVTPPRATGAGKETATRGKSQVEIDAERKNERIGDLGAKIERQRKRAEKTADTIEPVDIPYSAGTRETRQVAEDTADKMDALQRRMDALRKSVHTRDVTVTETTTRNDYHSITQDGRTVAELRREQDRLRFQYETLQNRLEQIKQDREHEERASVGYYTDYNNFNRTGKSENLSRIPSRNKFDEDEVKIALSGLKVAMEDLQRQIDERQ